MIRALVVDDKLENLYLLRVLLEGHGYAVEEARHGAEALVKARQTPPQIIISDLLMPVMDGYTLLRHWKADERLKAIPFVVYTATYTDSKDERLALELGADAFILKPCEPAPFITRIVEVLAKAVQGGLVPARTVTGEEKVVLKEYNEILVRKLEHKAMQLEQANLELREDIARREAAESESRRLLDETARTRAALLSILEDEREAQAALEERNRSYTTLVTNITGAIYRCRNDADWTVDFISDGCFDLTGYRSEEILGNRVTSLGALMHPEDAQPVWDKCQANLAAHKACSNEYRIIRRSGEVRWVWDQAQGFYADSGELLHVEGLITDITERRHDAILLAGQRRTLELIASGAPLGQALETLVRGLEDLLPGMTGSVLLLDDDGLHLRHGAAPHLPQEYIQAIDGMAIGPQVGSCGTAAHRAERVIVADIAIDPLWTDFRELALSHGLRGCWSTPILDAERHVIGTFALYYRTPRLPTEEELRAIDAVTGTAAIAIVKAREEAALSTNSKRLRELSRQLLEAQETERRSIARELHDEVGGVLTAVKLNLQSLRGKPARRASGVGRASDAALADGLALVDGAIRSVRSLSLDLHPAVLDDLGLIPAIKWYCGRTAQRAGVPIELSLDAIDLKSAPQLEIACFRIVQEALTNALRHARPSSIRVSLRRTDGSFTLEIADDGAGFAEPAARARALAGGSSGLLGMEERATLLGGRLEIETEPGAGARVRARFTVPEGGFA